MNWYVSSFLRYKEFVRGRARRTEFWLYMLAQTLLTAALVTLGYLWLDAILTELLKIPDPDKMSRDTLFRLAGFYLGSAVLIVALLATVLPTFGVAVRRLHDVGLSGWWLLIGVAPAAGWLTLLVMLCVDSEADANQFGLNPKLNPATAARRHVIAMRDEVDRT